MLVPNLAAQQTREVNNPRIRTLTDDDEEFSIEEEIKVEAELDDDE